MSRLRPVLATALSLTIQLAGCEGGTGTTARATATPLEGILIDVGTPYPPTRIVDVAVGSSGLIALADDMSGEIIVVEPDGSLKSHLGRRGDGPGEFRFLGAVAFGADDRLYAYDSSLQRVEVFGPNGVRVDGWRLEGLRGSGSSDVVVVGDSVFIRVLEPGMRENWRVYSTRGEMLAHAGPAGVPVADAPWTLHAESGLLAPIPGAPRLVSAVGVDGSMAYGDGMDDVVTVLSPDGNSHQQPLHMSARPFDRNAEAVIARWLESVPGVVGHLTLPPHIAYFREILFSSNGDLWLRQWVFTSPPGEPNPVIWTVYSKSGQLRGRFAFPARTEVRAVRGDTAWAIVPSELDESQLYRFSLPTQRR